MKTKLPKTITGWAISETKGIRVKVVRQMPFHPFTKQRVLMVERRMVVLLSPRTGEPVYDTYRTTATQEADGSWSLGDEMSLLGV